MKPASDKGISARDSVQNLKVKKPSGLKIEYDETDQREASSTSVDPIKEEEVPVEQIAGYVRR